MLRRLGYSIALYLVGALPAHAGSLELHAHLFMKQGMRWMFRGDFNGPLRANSYDDGLSSQANPESLEKSGIDLLVVSLYAHPLLSGDMRQAVREQIDLAEKFVREHPNWIIARNAREARGALNEGKRVMVLSLEGAAGIIENDEDIAEFVDRRGVRIVTLLHLCDDHLGGVAFLKGIRALASPWAFLSQLFNPTRTDGIRVNRNGLTDEGAALARKLIDKGVWIDLAHSSDEAQRMLLPILRETKQPILYTHTVLRDHHGAERAISNRQIDLLKETGGIIGLIPSREMLQGTPGARCSREALKIQFGELAGLLGSTQGIGLGSDFNGALDHLEPCSSDDPGLWNIGQSGEVWKTLGVSPSAAVDHFVKAWAKVSN